MKRVDDDVGHMSSLPSSLMTLGQVLKSTKAIMDRVLQVVHLSNLNLIIDWSRLIRHTRYSMHRAPFSLCLRGESFYSVKQDNLVLIYLPSRLCWRRASRMIPSWHLARNVGYCRYDSWPTSDPEHNRCHCSSCQSLRVASLIHEYTKFSMPGNSSFTLLNFKSNDAFHRVNIQNHKQRFKIPYWYMPKRLRLIKGLLQY